MFTSILAAALLFANGAPAAHHIDTVDVSVRKVSVDLANTTLEAAIVQVLLLAHVKYRFEPTALVIARSLRRTASFKGLPANDALLRLLINEGQYVLQLRERNGVFVVELPSLTVDIKDELPANAVDIILGSTGCDYCADVSEMGERRITMSLIDVPIDTAFRRVMAMSTPRLPYQLVFRHGFYLAMTNAISVHLNSAFDKRPIITQIAGHGRAEAIAAVFDCLHRSYVIYADTGLSGTVRASDETRTAEQLEDKLIEGTPQLLMRRDGADTVEIFDRPISTMDRGPRNHPTR